MTAPLTQFIGSTRIQRGLKQVISALLLCAPLLAWGTPGPDSGQNDSHAPATPAALAPFVEPHSSLMAWRHVDLNRDGRKDYLFILEREPPHADQPEPEEQLRPLKIALTQPNGQLRLALSNDTLVMCHACGGTWPDPFDELTAKPGSFTLSHYGGSRWRWSNRWRFDYDSEANSWFLSVATIGEDSADKGHQVRTYQRGKHFGPLRLDRFDREQFMAHQLRKH